MRVTSVDHYLALGPAGLADSVITCPFCGRNHKIPFREIHFGSGANQSILPVIHRCLHKNPTCVGIIYDKHIEEIIDTCFVPHLYSPGLKVLRYPLGKKNHHLEPEDEIGYTAAKQIDPSVEVLIGIGSGVICDLSKLIADHVDRPLVICGTAVSMNAYTSISGIITENKFKISNFYKTADSVIMDTDVLAGAPIEMTRAGMGDLAARAICNADFRLSHLLKGTWFCPLPFMLTAPFEKKYLAQAEGLGRSELQAVDALSQATLISGYSMTMVDGETFPSSGAEHAISHFWDLQHELFNAPKNLHGAQVAIGTLINLAMYDFLHQQNPSQFNISRIMKTRPSLEQIQTENIAKFGEAGKYLNSVVAEKWLTDDQLEVFFSRFLSNWHVIWEDLAKYMTPLDVISNAFRLAGVPTKLSSIHRSKEDGLDALRFSNRYRNRFTIMDLLNLLGLLPGISEEILLRANVLD